MYERIKEHKWDYRNKNTTTLYKLTKKEISMISKRFQILIRKIMSCCEETEITSKNNSCNLMEHSNIKQDWSMQVWKKGNI